MHSLFDAADRRRILARLRRLRPDSPRRWGRMTAAQMIVHLGDQMHHCLRDRPATPVPRLVRQPPAAPGDRTQPGPGAPPAPVPHRCQEARPPRGERMRRTGFWSGTYTETPPPGSAAA